MIKQKESVKYLGVYLDRNLNYQAKVKNILRKMACSIKTIFYVRDFLPEKTRLFLLKALVISHLQYSSVLLNGISQSLISTLEKQLNWGVKACFNRYKMDSFSKENFFRVLGFFFKGKLFPSLGVSSLINVILWKMSLSQRL